MRLRDDAGENYPPPTPSMPAAKLSGGCHANLELNLVASGYVRCLFAIQTLADARAAPGARRPRFASERFMTSPARLLEGREPCTLLKNFIARQGISLIAGLVFLAWTASQLVDGPLLP